MLDARQLRNVLAIIEKGSIRRAAEALRISQPALTKSIMRLEEQLQVPLFRRDARGMQPTLYGKCLGIHAQALTIGAAQALAEIAALKAGAIGIVSVGAPPVIAKELLPEPILRLKAEYRQVEIRVVTRTAGLIGALLAGEYDFIVSVMIAEAETAGLELQPLHDDHLVVIGRPGHPALGASKTSPAELRDHAWILPGLAHLHRQRLENAFEAAGLGHPRVALECDDTMLIKSMVADSDYIGLIPHIAADRDVRSGLLAAAAMDSRFMVRPISVLWRRNQVLSAPARLLMRFVEERSRAITNAA